MLVVLIFVAFSIMPASAPGAEDKEVDVEKKEVHYECEKDDWCFSPPKKKQCSADKDTIVMHSVNGSSSTSDSQGSLEKKKMEAMMAAALTS
jgi:hypothetical protein